MKSCYIPLAYCAAETNAKPDDVSSISTFVLVLKALEGFRHELPLARSTGCPLLLIEGVRCSSKAIQRAQQVMTISVPAMRPMISGIDPLPTTAHHTLTAISHFEEKGAARKTGRSSDMRTSGRANSSTNFSAVEGTWWQ